MRSIQSLNFEYTPLHIIVYFSIDVFEFVFMSLFPGSLITTPQPQEVTEGGSVWFSCSTDSAYGGIDWKHSYVGSVKPRDVYVNGMLVNGYKDSDRFSVDTSTIGSSDLFITNVQLHDAGVFICVDNNGAGKSSRAKLTVQGLNDNLTFYTIHIGSSQSSQTN